MERLNDILGRATPRRAHPSKQHNTPEQAAYEQEPPSEPYARPQSSYGQYSGQGQGIRGENAYNSTASGTRNPLREQRARLGQPPSGANPRNTAASGAQRQGYMEGNPRERRIPTGEQRSPLSPPRLGQGAGYTRQRPPTDEQRLYPPKPRLPEDSQQNRPASPAQRPPNGYQHGDNYQRSSADAVEAWEDEEDENTGMEYGDWEGGEQEVTIYRRQERDDSPRQHTGGDYGFPAQDYAPPSDGRSYPRLTRNLRGMQEPGIEQPQQQLMQQPPVPFPPARTQEMQARNPQYYTTQRRTQPLDPRTLAAFERDQKAPADEPLLREQGTAYAAEVSHSAVVISSLGNQRSVCPVCKGAGYLRIDVPFGHPNFGKPIACECKEVERKEKRRQQLVELSDLSAFYNKSFKNFNVRFSGVHPSVREAFHAARDFAQNPRGWLVLIGPNGCGKTHLAAAIANQTLSDGAVVLFTVVPDLLAHLRATFGPGATEAYEQRFSKMRESEVLVLDDLGAHQSSAWASEKLFQLLNYRYNSGYPTVITANETGMSSLDERIRSRISDTSLTTKVIMNGAPDYRPHNPRRL